MKLIMLVASRSLTESSFQRVRRLGSLYSVVLRVARSDLIPARYCALDERTASLIMFSLIRDDLSHVMMQIRLFYITFSVNCSVSTCFHNI